MPTKIDLIVLADEDNVGTALRDLPAGELARAAGSHGPLPGLVPIVPIRFGHKVAVRAILDGAPVVKHGNPIGQSTADIDAGEHVHVHNVVSLSRLQQS